MLTTSPTTIVSPCSGRASHIDDRLAGVDGGTKLEIELAIRLVHRAQRIAHREGGAHCALRVVSVRDRRPEDAEHGVADELLQATAVPLDLAANPLVVRRQERPYFFRVELLGPRREADDVDEEDADDAPLLAVDVVRQAGRSACRIGRSRGSLDRRPYRQTR